MQYKFAVFIFNEVEVLDFAGPFDVFTVGKLLGKEVADETAKYMQYDYWKS